MQIVEQECTDSDGNKGSFVLKNSETGESEGCFPSRKKAEQAKQIRKMKKNTERE